METRSDGGDADSEHIDVAVIPHARPGSVEVGHDGDGRGVPSECLAEQLDLAARPVSLPVRPVAGIVGSERVCWVWSVQFVTRCRCG